MFKTVAKFSIVFLVITAVTSANAFVVKKEDPLRPPEFKLEKSSAVTDKKAATVTAWRVNEILFSGERRIAIVNNIAVARGDRINGARVIDIKPEHVILDYKDKTITAYLKTVPVKKKSKKK